MLSDLPITFMSDEGGGMSLLSACFTKDGVQWGEHVLVEGLFALAEGVGLAKPSLPREFWSILPGSMPYYTIDSTALNEALNRGNENV